MAAVTQRIPNYLGGISKQSDDQMLPGTLKDIVNAYPEPSFGLVKRPGFEYIRTLQDDQGDDIARETFDNAFWFTVTNLVDGKRVPYFGCITPATDSLNPGIMYMWRSTDGEWVTVTDNSSYLNVLFTEDADDIVTSTPVTGYDMLDGDTVCILTNKQVVVAASGNNTLSAPTGYSTYADVVAATGVTDGDVAHVLNSNGPEDDYYLLKITTAGKPWEECPEPGVPIGLSNTTMPHELEFTGDLAVQLKPRIWGDRTAGNEAIIPSPTFIGQRITKTFFYSNRFGVLSQDSIVLTRAGEDNQFYGKSALVQTDADPIDMKTSTTVPAFLNHAIPQANGLLLFSSSSVFVLYSDSGALSPNTAVVRKIASYENDAYISPVEIGTEVVFLARTRSYCRLFGMSTQGYQENPIVKEITKTVAELIPNTVNTLDGNSQTEVINLVDPQTRYMYLYRSYDPGDQDDLKAWVRWQLPAPMLGSTVLEDSLIGVFQVDDGTTGCYMIGASRLTKSLGDAGGDFIIGGGSLGGLQQNKGNQGGDFFSNSAVPQFALERDIFVNPCIDFYAIANTITYDSTTKRTTITLPYNDDATYLKPVVLIEDDRDDSTLDSGYIREVDEDTRTRTTWQVNGDLSEYVDGADSRIVVGYKYAMDLRLPVTFFNAGGLFDVTASLTIARMKFIMGRGGAFGFKLRTRGVDEVKYKVADPVVNSFYIDFEYKEENLRVVVNGDYLEDSAWSIGTEDNVILTVAPTTGDWVIIQQDKLWKEVIPVTDADIYLADDGPLANLGVFTIPIYQRNSNFIMRLYTDSPFPSSLNSMMWEGNYAPRYYSRS